MPLNIETIGEQDKEQSKEWLVNIDPGILRLQRVTISVVQLVSQKKKKPKI